MAKIVKLGSLVEYYDEINKDGEFSDIDDLQGINSKKYFQECKSNKNDINLKRYKICRNKTFAYNKATSRNGEKISIAYRTGGDCLISPSYYTFKIKDRSVILPEYLLLLFSKPSFDRYARFNSWGSATEFLNWEDFCDMEIKIVDIDEQKRIVNEYNVINNRINILNEINNQINNMVKIIFNKEIIREYTKKEDSWESVELKSICDIKGGKRLPAGEELQEECTKHPYIRVRDVTNNKYVVLDNKFLFINDDIYEKISRYIVKKDDIIISIVGTIGLVGKVHESLDGANLTENCMKMTNIKKVPSDFIYYTLCNLVDTNEIEERIVGAVQSKLPMYNIETIPIIIPDENTITKMENIFDKTNECINSNIKEIILLEKMKNMILSKI